MLGYRIGDIPVTLNDIIKCYLIWIQFIVGGLIAGAITFLGFTEHKSRPHKIWIMLIKGHPFIQALLHVALLAICILWSLLIDNKLSASIAFFSVEAFIFSTKLKRALNKKQNPQIWSHTFTLIALLFAAPFIFGATDSYSQTHRQNSLCIVELNNHKSFKANIIRDLDQSIITYSEKGDHTTLIEKSSIAMIHYPKDSSSDIDYLMSKNSGDTL